jgi:hypothetical protein
MDSASNNERIRRSTNEYANKFLNLSDTRFMYLEKMIRYLDDYGQIVFIREPVSSQMAVIEKRVFPDFDLRVHQLAAKYNIPYFNFIDESGKFLTIDTHHLYKAEAERFTYMICDSILNYYKNESANLRLANSGSKPANNLQD